MTRSLRPAHVHPAALVAVPQAMDDAVAELLKSAEEARATAVVTVHHPCQMNLCTLEKSHGLAVVNYVALLAQTMGIEFSDEYKTGGIPTRIYTVSSDMSGSRKSALRHSSAPSFRN